MKSLICKFIKENANWRELLSAEPYCLKIKEEGNYVLFKYNQLDSDFYNPIVREARGIIIDIDRIAPVCWAFNKFGNYGEGYADEIDWSTARVQEKVDGSIIKVWYDHGWHVSSNSRIDAYAAVLDQSGVTIGDLVDVAGLNTMLLDVEYTHIFELVSPYNRVVVDYGEDVKLYYLGRRNIITGEEEIVNDIANIKTPRSYSLGSLEECLAAAKALEVEGDNVQHEGFVVVDGNFNRIKIKSPAYVAMHHIRAKQPTFENMFEVWLNNEQGEFLSVFPIYKEVFDFIDFTSVKIATEITIWKPIANNLTKAEFAKSVKDKWFSSILFKCYDLNDWSLDNYIINYKEYFVKILKNRWKREKNG